MASVKLIEPKKKPKYFQLTAIVMVNGKSERRYGRFDFDPTELKTARQRLAAANAAAVEFEREQQAQIDKEMAGGGKTFEQVAREYIDSNRSLLEPSARLKGDAEQHRNKANTTRNKRWLPQQNQRLSPVRTKTDQCTITKKDCDQVLRLLEKGCTRVYQRATLKPGAKAYKTMSCPKIAEFCTIKEETVEKSFRGESVSLDSAQQIAKALGQEVETLFEVETDERPITQKTMREYVLFIRAVINYANENYNVDAKPPQIRACGKKGKSVDCLHKDEVERLQQTLKECSLLERAIILSLLNTGVRRGELAGLTWQDVNFKECTIHISKSLLVFQNFGYQLTATKENNVRDVDVAPEFMAFLEDYYRQWKAQKKVMGAAWQKSLDRKSAKYASSLLALRGNDFVICNDHGFPINPDSYGSLVRRVGKKAGIEGLHPHMFRHTFVSILLSNPQHRHRHSGGGSGPRPAQAQRWRSIPRCMTAAARRYANR